MNLAVPQEPTTTWNRYLLSAQVDHALARGLEVHPDNRQFQTLPQDKENTLSRPKNVKGRSFSWSYSALSAFENCPFAYAEDRFYKRVAWVDTEPQKWGVRVHESGQHFVEGKPITDPDAFKEVEKYARYFKKLKDEGAEVIPEMQIVLQENMQPLTTKDAWFSDKAWFRVALDVPVIRGKEAGIFDYKTGKFNSSFPPSDDQLKICACALSVVRPEIEVFTPKLIWTRDQKSTGIATGTINKADIPNIWAGILQRVKRVEDAWRSEVWQGKPSGLCKWKTGQCASYDNCPYARGK